MGTTHYSFVLRIGLAMAPIYGNDVFAWETTGKGCKEKERIRKRKGSKGEGKGKKE